MEKMVENCEEVLSAQSGEIPVPLVRHTCPACRDVTLADRDAMSVTCAACDHVIVEVGVALESFRMYLERHFPQLLDLPLALGAVPEGEYVRDYARVDAEISYLLIKLPLEVALERRQKERDS